MFFDPEHNLKELKKKKNSLFITALKQGFLLQWQSYDCQTKMWLDVVKAHNCLIACRWGQTSVRVRLEWLLMEPGDTCMIQRLRLTNLTTRPPSACRWEPTKEPARFAHPFFNAHCNRSKCNDDGPTNLHQWYRALILKVRSMKHSQGH